MSRTRSARTAIRAGHAPAGGAVHGPGGPAGDDRGAVTLFVAITVVGLLVLAGLVVDGGAKVRAVQRADRLAAQAARAAGQAVDIAGVLAGDEVGVDRRAALVAAEAYLRAAGAEGSARVVDGGAGISVATTASVPTVFLGLIGIPQFSAQGSATVALVH
ncbi:MAG: pilus assembly protein TadG-related protein [Candidatus Nanopelagicales bacterium]